MMENWFTSAQCRVRRSVRRRGSKGEAQDERSLPGKSGRPSSISAKMHPALQMSTARATKSQSSANRPQARLNFVAPPERVTCAASPVFAPRRPRTQRALDPE